MSEIPVVKIINEHFDNLINKINFNISTLLEKENLDDGEKTALNEIRQEQVDKIEEVKLVNLTQNLEIVFNEFKNKNVNLFNDSSLNESQKTDLIKESLIRKDCILVKDNELKSKLGVLVTDSFINSKVVEFLE